jgi:tRNA (mo5U34)-methyltransferase
VCRPRKARAWTLVGDAEIAGVIRCKRNGRSKESGMSDRTAALEGQVLAQKWFYRYRLPSGRETEMYINDEVEHIHQTRRSMMLGVLQPLFDRSGDELTALDFASHQGFFSLELAQHCKQVRGLEYQQRHVDSARLISAALGVSNVEFRQENLETMPPGKHEPADIVIAFGLMYNLENPIAVLRHARNLTRKVLLIETQVTILDLEGAIDSGHHSSTNFMHGYFGIFSGNPHNIDGSASDVVLYPSRKGLIWLLEKFGFSRVAVVPPPHGAYQQLATGKRIMVEAWV